MAPELNRRHRFERLVPMSRGEGNSGEPPSKSSGRLELRRISLWVDEPDARALTRVYACARRPRARGRSGRPGSSPWSPRRTRSRLTDRGTRRALTTRRSSATIAAHGDIAQLVERVHGMHEVKGSNPFISTTRFVSRSCRMVGRRLLLRQDDVRACLHCGYYCRTSAGPFGQNGSRSKKRATPVTVP